MTGSCCAAAQHARRDLCVILDARGFVASPSRGQPGDYVIERAFVE
jgi:ferredoxin--NADP+ reductase